MDNATIRTPMQTRRPVNYPRYGFGRIGEYGGAQWNHVRPSNRAIGFDNWALGFNAWYFGRSWHRRYAVGIGSKAEG